MHVQIEEKTPVTRQIEITLGEEEITPIIEETLQAYQKRARIDGFRRGKAPLHLVRKQYHAEIVREVVETLQVHAWRRVREEHAILSVAPPVVIRRSDFSLDVPAFDFTLEVEVMPEITVDHYKGVKVEKEIVTIEEEDVERFLALMRERDATFEDVEGGAEPGHFLEGDIQVLDEHGLPLIGQKWENRVIELAAPPLDEAAIERLVGARTGETRSFVIPQRDQEGSPPARYAIAIHAVKRKVLPPLDDHYAQKVGEFSTLQTLKEAVRKRLQDNARKQSEEAVVHQIADEIIRKNDFILPRSMAEEALHEFWEAHRKEHPEDDESHFKETYRADIVRNLKWMLLLRKIAEVEGIQVEDAAINAEIERIAEGYGKDASKVRALYRNPEMRDRLGRRLLEQATIRFLMDHAKVKEVVARRERPSRIVFPT